ncbi:MAG TPA: cupin domain-containing protein [Solirubrobacterales bacterium]|nr:cupin domain-containing protein [Solirubrobacterales bacterium]
MGIHSRKLKLSLAGLGVFAVGSLAGGVAISAVKDDPPAPKYNSLARTVNPIGAKGKALGLSRVVIQPGAKIPLHYHEGTQVSYIQSGTLTYTVRDGGVKVMTGPGDDGKVVRRIKAGQTGKIKAGQWIVEQPTTIHRANNFGDDKIVIYLSNLLDKNAAPSTLVP